MSTNLAESENALERPQGAGNGESKAEHKRKILENCRIRKEILVAMDNRDGERIKALFASLHVFPQWPSYVPIVVPGPHMGLPGLGVPGVLGRPLGPLDEVSPIGSFSKGAPSSASPSNS